MDGSIRTNAAPNPLKTKENQLDPHIGHGYSRPDRYA
jgi:hypothetical protein